MFVVVGDEPQLRARVPRGHVRGDEACKQKGMTAQPKYPGGRSGERKVGLRGAEGVGQRLRAEAVWESFRVTSMPRVWGIPALS